MFQLTLTHCSHTDIDSISELLEELGAVSVTLTDQHDHPILEPGPGEVPLWPDIAVDALYLTEHDAKHAVEALQHQYPTLISTIETVIEQDWERVCLQDFHPQQFGQRLWICPSWLTPPEPTAVNIILDPGLAFGTGTHPTTGLCLTWLDQADLGGKAMIDYGCGSGILAIAALKLGAKHVYAVDIDPQALDATQHNAFNNQISVNQISVSMPDNLTHPVDFLVANILLTPLLNLKQRFATLLQAKGQLIVSGLLATQCHELINAYQSDFKHCESRIDGDWALLRFVKK